MIRLTAILAMLLFLSGCEIISFKDYAYPPYDGELVWTQVTKKAEWPERYDHAAAVYNGYLWVMGGYNPGQVKGDTYFEDVWKSSDGKTWEQVQANAPWKGRRGHKVLVFDDGSGDAMFLLGGYSVDEESGYRQYCNDVWKSTNGIDWQQIKPRTYPELNDSTDWMPRMNHGVVVASHDGIRYIYLIAGRTQLENHDANYSSIYFNDVWRSTDGNHWEKVMNNDYGIRSEHGIAVDPSTGRIYVQGGVHGINFEAPDYGSHPLPNWQALWYSDNGKDWSPLADTITVTDTYRFRSAHGFVFFKGKLWSLPGKTVSNNHYEFGYSSLYSTWNYEEPGTWVLDSEGTDIDARHSYATVVFNDKLWILGGFTGSNGQSNDVWSAQ